MNHGPNKIHEEGQLDAFGICSVGRQKQVLGRRRDGADNPSIGDETKRPQERRPTTWEGTASDTHQTGYERENCRLCGWGKKTASNTFFNRAIPGDGRKEGRVQRVTSVRVRRMSVCFTGGKGTGNGDHEQGPT